ncbi:MAG: hypothetical protein AB8G99_05845 [Planctomycetaceae bacterium]
MIQLRMTLALLLLLGGVCSAQSSNESQVLVFGDVSKPGLYVEPQAASVSSLIARANGLSCKTANARIIRVGEKGAQVVWAAHLSQGQPCTEKLTTGDILVVHSLDRMAGQKQPPMNVAVINSELLPLFVDLEPGAGVKASDVMADKNVNLAGRRFEVVRTNPQAIPVQPNVDAVLMHGDLLMVGQKLSTLTSSSQIRTVSQEVPGPPAFPGPGKLSVPMSDSSIQGVSQQTDDTEPIPVEANYGALPPLPPTPNNNQMNQGFNSPMTPQGVTQPPVPASPGNVTDPLSIDPFASPSGNNMMQPPAGMQAPAGMQPPLANPGMPGYNNMQPGVPGMTNPYGTQMPNSSGSVTTSGYPQTADNSATETDASALPLPSELDSAAVIDDSSNATMWYVAGLGAALLLVLGAWVYGSRAVAESPQIDKARYKRPVSARHSEKIKHPPVSASMPTASPATSQPAAAKPAKPTIKSIASAATPTTPTAPTAPVAQPAAPPVQPIQQSMPQQPQAAPVAASVPQPAMPTPSAPVQQTAYMPQTQTPVQQPIAPPARPVQSVAATPRQPVQSFESLSLPVSQAPLTAPAQTAAVPPAAAEPIPVPDTSTTQVLDALINNSIPITEQPVQLPVHLEFYGDSSGPKHLRFDPPENALRGHHLGARAGAGQKQTTNTEAQRYQ